MPSSSQFGDVRADAGRYYNGEATAQVQEMNVLDAARRYVEAGLSVIPVRTGGSKAPALKPGVRKEFEQRLPTDEELRRFFGGGRSGLAVLCGPVSGNLEAIDFDKPGALQEFEEIAADHGASELVQRLVQVRSPRDPSCGHLYYRCPEGVGRHSVPAHYLNDGKRAVKIEVRGEGFYCIVPGGPPTVHETGRPYELVRGDLRALPEITAEEREQLLRFIRMCDELPEIGPSNEAVREWSASTRSLSPFDDYAERGREHLEEVLVCHGAAKVGENRWRRPGKTVGHSASLLDHCFYCFSDNFPPFEQDRGYSYGDTYALLEHQGDRSAAARALRNLDYGSPPVRSNGTKPAATRPVVNEYPHHCASDPDDNTATDTTATAQAAPAAILLRRTFADIEREIGGIEWAWKRWLPCGSITMLASSPGIGKSLLALEIARIFTEGELWPDGQGLEDGAAEAGKVLWCETEGGMAANIERARNLGMNLTNMVVPLEDMLATISLSDPDHQAAILQNAQADDVSMVIVDSFSAGFSGDENTSAALEPMKWLNELAGTIRKPVLVIHHLRKRGTMDTISTISLDRVRGHSSIVQLPRVVWGLTKPDPDQKDARRLEVIKSNLGTIPDPLGLAIGEGGCITFTTEAPTAPPKPTKLQVAIDFLLECLNQRALPVPTVETEAERRGIVKRTLRRAREELGVITVKDQSGVWSWALNARVF